MLCLIWGTNPRIIEVTATAWLKVVTLAGQSNYYSTNDSQPAGTDPCLAGRQYAALNTRNGPVLPLPLLPPPEKEERMIIIIIIRGGGLPSISQASLRSCFHSPGGQLSPFEPVVAFTNRVGVAAVAALARWCGGDRSFRGPGGFGECRGRLCLVYTPNAAECVANPG